MDHVGVNGDETAAVPSPLVDFIAGTVGGIASLLAGHPFDTIKTRLQAQTAAATASSSSPTITPTAHSPLVRHANTAPLRLPPRYTSAWDALRRIVAEERVVGLYKGITSPMLGVAAMNASVFGVYGLALRSLDGGASTADAPSSLTNIFLAGCASGVVSALITSPIELIKIRQQLTFASSATTSAAVEPSTWSVVRTIWQRGGVRGLYRGLGCTCVRDLGYGPYFLSYEMLNRLFASWHNDSGSDTPQRLSNVEMALSGGLAGVLAWLSTFGADVIKTRVQATERSASGGGSGGAFWSTARSIYRQGGWRAFFAGAGPTVVRALPVNAVLFLTFEATKDSLTRMGF